MPDDKVQIAFKGTMEYRDSLQDEARKRRMKVQALLENAVAAYLAGAASEDSAQRPALSRRTKHDPDLEAFINWYQNASDDLDQALRKFIRARIEDRAKRDDGGGNEGAA